jgi:hypothetical protein
MCVERAGLRFHLQVIALAEYRAQLYEYLKNRMTAIAPNLTVLVGELVGARLIAHAGSLVNLAKAPASTIQILGAEKALFRALKTKHEVPVQLSHYPAWHPCWLDSPAWAPLGSRGRWSASLGLAMSCCMIALHVF